MTEAHYPTQAPNAVEHTSSPEGHSIRLVGEIDMTSWPRLEDVYEAVAAADPAPVTVDLSGATFVDSATLGFLARLHDHVTGNGNQLVLRSPNTVVARALQVTGLDRTLTIDPG
jgi:anti-sigma B factor antagonist